MSIGRGLGALITSTGRKQITNINVNGETKPVDRVWVIPTSKIIANPNQPRKHFSPTELNELAESIKQYGILQPLLVSEQADGNYELIVGERRLRAAKIAGLATVPVMVKELADSQKLEVALIENIQRENLNPIEEAFAFKRLAEEFGLTQQEVAGKVGKSRPAIANAVRLLELPPAIQTALIEGKINTGQARALLGIEDKKQQLELLSSMLGQKITVRELEREVVKRQAPGEGKGRRDPNLLYLEDQLRSTLGTKVTISQKGERGVIGIDYFSLAERAQIIKKIIGQG